MAATYEPPFPSETATASLLANAEAGQTPRSDGQPGAQPAAGGFCACLSVRYYQPYFDVDTAHVVDRVKYAIFPFRREQTFIATIGANPDAYGPFWVATTLVFVVGVVHNFARWIHGASAYDFQKVVTCACIVYSFMLAIPSLMWVVLRYIGLPLPLIQAGCIYGYSLVAFVPLTVIASVPAPYIAWLAEMLAGGMSAVFLVKALGPTLLDKAPSHAVPILGGVGAVQLVLALCIKLLFFKD